MSFWFHPEYQDLGDTLRGRALLERVGGPERA